jgi:hypothetical protein
MAAGRKAKRRVATSRVVSLATDMATDRAL